jgi:hypothetical protein
MYVDMIQDFLYFIQCFSEGYYLAICPNLVMQNLQRKECVTR